MADLPRRGAQRNCVIGFFFTSDAQVFLPLSSILMYGICRRYASFPCTPAHFSPLVTSKQQLHHASSRQKDYASGSHYFVDDSAAARRSSMYRAFSSPPHAPGARRIDAQNRRSSREFACFAGGGPARRTAAAWDLLAQLAGSPPATRDMRHFFLPFYRRSRDEGDFFSPTSA